MDCAFSFFGGGGALAGSIPFWFAANIPPENGVSDLVEDWL